MASSVEAGPLEVDTDAPPPLGPKGVKPAGDESAIIHTMKPTVYIQSADMKSIELDKSQPIKSVQIVQQTADGMATQGLQPAFVLEFNDNIGDATSETVATQFNQLIAKMERCGILQRPNSSDN